MRIVPYTPHYRQAWNALCDKSDDAWFWHTRDWFDYAGAILGPAVMADASFLVTEGEAVLAIAPGMAIAGLDQQPARLGLADQPVPWPAYSPQLGAQQRLEAERLVFAEYQNAALRLDLGRIELFGVVLANSFRRSRFPLANLPLRYGYVGAVFDTQVIDLTQPVESLWRNVRKGHKSAIKAGQKGFSIRHWLGDVSDEDFRAYQELHALAAGRVTRSQATFDAMRLWIRNGAALLAGAHHEGRWIGFVYVLLYRGGAFYASACNHPELALGLPVGHALLWEAIVRCREAGIELLEMGLQTYPSHAATAESDKLISIARFKRGFGGFPMPRYHAHLAIDSSHNTSD